MEEEIVSEVDFSQRKFTKIETNLQELTENMNNLTEKVTNLLTNQQKINEDLTIMKSAIMKINERSG